ncbi:MAG: TIGR03067 domain-containing protein [Gemmataceae bacterium]
MSTSTEGGLPRWLVVATGIVGLVAASLVAASRYYETRKARAEAAAAEASLKAPPPAPEPVAPASTPTDPLNDLAPDERQVQGRWEAISINVDRKTFGPPPTDEEWTFDGKVLTMQRKDQGKRVTIEGRFALVRAGEQRQFDYSGTGWGKLQVKFRGIYRLEGNLLTLCFVLRQIANPKDQRPTTFGAPPGSGRVLVTLRRL